MSMQGEGELKDLNGVNGEFACPRLNAVNVRINLGDCLVEMENFFILGSGGIISAVGLKMGIDYPAGNYMFAPLGVIGVATMVFGVLQSVPFLPESARVVQVTLIITTKLLLIQSDLE
jgi:hypothetical protein